MNLSKFKKKPRHKIVVGSVETIIIDGKKYKARIDTGAARSSICTSLIDKISLGSPITSVKTKSANGETSRVVFAKEIIIAGRNIKATFSVTDRETMTYDILIGRNVLERGGFLVDVSK